jgi:choline dehydrogenase-like flavoprotein
VNLELLTALADTVVPPVHHDPDPDGFFARKASDIGVPAAMADALAGAPELQPVLDGIAAQGFLEAPPEARMQILTGVAESSPEAAAGVQSLIGLTLFLYYGLPENPSWETFGYPGPLSQPPQAPKPIEPLVVERDTTIEADVCVVGSGAGGGVMAGVLSQHGLRVVVLEAGGYFDEPDFAQLELVAYQRCYWRGGPTPTADLNVSLLAGACLGGGTTINWMNSLRTTPWVRDQWEREFGLEGLAGAKFDRHLDAVWSRLRVNDRCSDLNGPHRKMREGAEALGWRFAVVQRNAEESRYSFQNAGFSGFGDQSGTKQSTLKTYLRDAFERGATIVTGCRAERVLVSGGRAAGVSAVCAHGPRVEVRSPQVVVAAGALESPALLLRSGIGGPAVGHYLRLHPTTASFGFYDEDLRAWEGAPQAALVHEFENLEDGYGFMIEGAQYTTGLGGSALPFTDPVSHKRTMARFKYGGTLIGLLRDHGHGQITIDRYGDAVPTYAMTDEVDARNAQAAMAAHVRLHAAAGATEVVALAAGAPAWHAGEDLDSFIAGVQQIPLGFGGWTLFSAHQMGTCRMGVDPGSSVAGPWGELHDVRGVWIGDTSAFPTSSGTNPMITVMALAHRNAEAVVAAAPVAAASTT